MPSTGPPIDPLGEIVVLTRELSSLEAQLAGDKITREHFASKSQELKDRISNAESLAYSMAKTDESVARKLRAKIYGEPEVQQICNHFIYGSKNPLAPEFGADRVPSYSMKLGTANVNIDRALLQRLSETRILNAVLFEKILFCPKCSTPSNVYARFKCTQCGSIDIAINRMIEHLACGTIHEEKAFRIGNTMICPTCKKVILASSTSEKRLIGLVCACNKCGAHFEDPSQSYFCRGCEVDFNLTTGIITDVYTYSINDEILTEIRSQTGIPPIADLLQNNGFELTIPGIIVGEGKSAQFSILARKGAKVIAIDVASNAVEVGVEPILELYIKLLETKADTAVLGAIPRVSVRARDVAAKHGISVAEGSTPAEVAHKILEIVGSDIETSPAQVGGKT